MVGSGTVKLVFDNKSTQSFETFGAPSYIVKGGKITTEPQLVGPGNATGNAGVFQSNAEPTGSMIAISVYKVPGFDKVLILYIAYTPGQQSNVAKAGVYDEMTTTVGDALLVHVSKNPNVKSQLREQLANAAGGIHVLTVKCTLGTQNPADAKFELDMEVAE